MIPYIFLILAGIFLGYTKFLSLACIASIPYAIKAIKHIDQYTHIDKFVPGDPINWLPMLGLQDLYWLLVYYCKRLV